MTVTTTIEQFVAERDARNAIIRNATENVEVGTIATFGIGADRYAASVTYVSPSKKTIHVSPGGKFMLRNGRYTSGARRSGYVTLGVSEEYMDPSF